MSVARGGPASEGRADMLGGVVARWVSVVRARWATGVMAGTAVLLLGVAWVFLARPIHRAEARLRLAEPPPMGGASPTSGILGLLRPGGDPFANDLELIESRTLGEGVVEDVTFHVRLIAPSGWHRDSVFEALGAERTTEEQTYVLTWGPEGVTVLATVPEDSLIGVYPIGRPATFGGVTAAFAPPRDEMPDEMRLWVVPFDRAVREFRSALVVERARRDANVVDLSFDHTDPRVARQVVQSTVSRFHELRQRLQRRESGESVDSLRAVAIASQAELRAVEDSLRRLQERTRLINAEIQGEALVERYSEAAVDLSKTEAELAAIDSILAVVADRSGPDVWTTLLSFPPFLENETIGTVLTSLIELEQARSDLLLRRTPENRDVRAVEQRIAGLDERLRSLAVAYRRGVQQASRVLRREYAALDSVLGAVPSVATDVGRLQRRVYLLSQVYVLTEQRLRQEELREALTYANVQVVDPPALRDKPVWPRKKLGLAVSILLAGGGAVMAMAVREAADRSVRSASEIAEWTGAPVLLTVRRGRNGHAPLVGGDDADFLRRSTRGGGETGAALAPQVTLAGVNGDRMTDRLLAAIAGSNGNGAEAGTGFAAVAPIVTRRRAAEAAARGAPVELVVEWGKTRLPDLDRAVALLRESGAHVAGVIVVCPTRRSERDVWS